MARVGAIIIGNEILTGKFADQNTPWLALRCRALGLDLVRVLVIPDEVPLIGSEVVRLARELDWVFTTGGVGPTHDDVTLAAVGAAFGMPLERNAELEGLLRAGIGPRLHERDLRMADIPTGARLEYGPRGLAPVGAGHRSWPVVVVENVWILPGVPSIFRRKFELVRELFRAAPIHARAVYSREGEGPIAGALDETVAAFPTVEIGSYPHLDAPDYRVKITLDGRDRAAVDAATDSLVARLGAAVVRTE